MGRMQSEVIGSGETETAADGSFVVPVVNARQGGYASGALLQVCRGGGGN